MGEIFKFAKVRNVKSPERGTPLSAGIDFFVPEDFKPCKLHPGRDLLIPSGIKSKFSDNYMLIAENKSGVVTSKRACLKAGRKPKREAFESVVIVGASVVDADYQGEIHIHIINVGSVEVDIRPGMKIAQFILVPVSYADIVECDSADELYESETERGKGGFGSTN